MRLFIWVFVFLLSLFLGISEVLNGRFIFFLKIRWYGDRLDVCVEGFIFKVIIIFGRSLF